MNLSGVPPPRALFILAQDAGLSLLTSPLPRTVKLGPDSSADGTLGSGSKEHSAKAMWRADFVNRLPEKNDEPPMAMIYRSAGRKAHRAHGLPKAEGVSPA